MLVVRDQTEVKMRAVKTASGRQAIHYSVTPKMIPDPQRESEMERDRREEWEWERAEELRYMQAGDLK